MGNRLTSRVMIKVVREETQTLGIAEEEINQLVQQLGAGVLAGRDINKFDTVAGGQVDYFAQTECGFEGTQNFDPLGSFHRQVLKQLHILLPDRCSDYSKFHSHS